MVMGTIFKMEEDLVRKANPDSDISIRGTDFAENHVAGTAERQ